MDRRLSEEWFTPRILQFLAAIAEDPELQAEIRNNVLTIYYRGAALVRDLQLKDQRLTGKIHHKYIPVTPRPSSYVPVALQDSGLSFAVEVQPLPLGNLTPEVVAQYKRVMKSVAPKPEAAVVHELVIDSRNRIVDQEISFQDKDKKDKIDLCNFDLSLNCLAMVEVKQIDDPRLRSTRTQGPEVVEQLQRYSQRIAERTTEIRQAFQNVIAFKHRLGFGNRLADVPREKTLRLLKKPILVIGGCERGEIQQILREDEWELLMTELAEHAAAVLFCGNKGRSLQWIDRENNNQGRGFDDSQWD